VGVQSPDLMDKAFLERFNARDAPGLLALYAPDAVYTFNGKDKAIGLGQIEAAMAGILGGPLKLRGSYTDVLVAGDTALCRLKWELIDSSGAVQSAGVSSEVLRRGGDGKWRFQIDDASGGGRPA
jgi:uncharacterized protein (TIGR02246 family)